MIFQNLKEKRLKTFVSKSNLNFNIYNIADKDSSEQIIKQLNLLKVKRMSESKPNYFNIFKINLIEELSKILKIFMFKSRNNTNQKMPVQLSKKFISNQIINIMRKKDFRVNTLILKLIKYLNKVLRILLFKALINLSPAFLSLF